MRPGHLDEFKPICLVCSRNESTAFPIQLEIAFKESGEHVVEGVLQCSNPACQFEYPIVDGVPLLVPNVRELVAASANWLLLRDDLDPVTQSLIRDCEGPDGVLHQIHQLWGTYGWCHYGDLDPELNDEDAGSSGKLWRELSQMVQPVSGHQADFGCSVGRTTFEMAKRSNGLTLGLDMNLGFLRMASKILRTGKVTYPFRRSGIVYEEHSFAVDWEESSKVDFWACDLHQLPFAQETFAAVHSLNTIDSVISPLALLQSISNTLNAGGQALLASPYDWTSNVTPIEGWLGGHSQRAPHRGDSPTVLKQILADPANGLNQLSIVHEKDDVPWIMRIHDRNRTHYCVHSAVLQKK